VKHTLSLLDSSRRRAFCSACGGVVPIIKNGRGGWRCAEANKRHHRRFRDQGRHGEHLRHRKPYCEWCGFTPAVVAGRPVLGMLHVHHRDGNRDNNDRANLVTLCWHCHASIHATDRLVGPQRHGELIRVLLRAIENQRAPRNKGMRRERKAA
jgi:hypothetical protein